jgi:hypothetical protein
VAANRSIAVAELAIAVVPSAIVDLSRLKLLLAALRVTAVS